MLNLSKINLFLVEDRSEILGIAFFQVLNFGLSASGDLGVVSFGEVDFGNGLYAPIEIEFGSELLVIMIKPQNLWVKASTLWVTIPIVELSTL